MIIREPLKSAQREKAGGQPAKRACPRVFSKTQANRSISFARFARSQFFSRKSQNHIFDFFPNLPQGLCGKSECGDFDNKRAVTDRRREKTDGLPAERASPRVFSETQANRSISFARFARSKIISRKSKNHAFCFFPQFAARLLGRG